MALLRNAAGLHECLLIGEDRKSSASGQNDAIDPQQTSDTQRPMPELRLTPVSPVC